MATSKDIEVKLGKNQQGAKLDDDTKILRWKLALEPKSSQKMEFDYSVKYPKNRRLILN